MSGERTIGPPAGDVDSADGELGRGHARESTTRQRPPSIERFVIDAVIVDQSTGETGIVASWAVADADEDIVSVQLTVIDGERQKTSVTELVYGDEISGTTMVGLGGRVVTRRSGRVLVRLTVKDATGATASAIRPATLLAPGE
ncbi:hypothetical protein [Haloarchaeobius sp. TZWWS8]|uniref:hypothetical protein n=1 Tax=Haloarchaeobius sp. TZWWS8 TaxID=3446121 RepID=UPI003EBA6425